MDINTVNVGRVLARNGRYHPEKTAIIFEGRRISYQELNNRANRLYHGIMGMGVKKGDKVAILFYNSPQFIESYFAIVKAGAVVVPLNFRLAARELEYQIDNSDAAILIYSEEFKEVIESIRSNLKKVKEYICWGEDIPSGSVDYEKLIAGSPDPEPQVEVNEEDGCVIYYTAGTTGLPKGAYRTHHNVLWTAAGYTIAFSFSFDDIISGFPPFFHLAGFEAFTLPTFVVGGTVVVAKAFDPQKAIKAIQDEKVTTTFMVPAMSIAVWNLPDINNYDLSSLRIYMTASAPLATEMKKKIIKNLPHVKFFEGYGMTETGELTELPPKDAMRKDMCVGIPAFHVRIRLVDDEGKDVPRGEIGEVVAQGPCIIREYYKEPEKTKETIRDGWFHTGDLGRFDEEGYLYLVDRKKDMVLTGGENVYSAEVENVIFKHPKVLEASIIGLPDEKWGEVVTAVVVLKPEEKMTEEELIDLCRKDLAGYKCPKVVKFLDTPLPRNTFGKVLKRELREKFSKEGGAK